MKQKKLKSELDNTRDTKKLICLFGVFFLLCVSNLFAADSGSATSGLNDVFYTVLKAFTGWYVKVIALAGIVVIGIKMITAKGEEKLIKALVPWFVAAILIGSGSLICGLFIKDFDTQINAATGSNLLDKL